MNVDADEDTVDVGITIESIEVDELFGQYNYRLPIPVGAADADLSRLILFYGDNGVGKTTILRSLFHLLSSAPSRGHKTELLSVPFRRIAIRFREGVHVSAIRSGDSLLGGYRLVVADSERTLLDHELVVSSENSVRLNDNPELNQLPTVMGEKCPFAIHYLGDDRQFQSDVEPEPWSGIRTVRVGGELRYVSDDSGQFDDPLESLVERATQWLRRQSIQASARGDLGTNGLYADVLRRIASPTPTDDLDTFSVDRAAETIDRIGRRNADYQALGLVPRLDSVSIRESLDAATGSIREEAFLRVAMPFLEGLETRLDALATLYRSMAAFESAINSFYVNKTVSLTLPDGIEVIANNGGDRLEVAQLSSGERQLLLLFVNALFAHDRPALFIVDEPELSLNVKWQRRLVPSLLRATAETPTQFLLATHSFEILTGAKDRVVNVEPFFTPDARNSETPASGLQDA